MKSIVEILEKMFIEEFNCDMLKANIVANNLLDRCNFLGLEIVKSKEPFKKGVK